MSFTGACTTDQHGGWKSKGGSRNPVDPPSFTAAEPTTEIFSRTFRVNEAEQFQKDLLICESSSSATDGQLQLTYDIIGSLIGFELYESQNQRTNVEIKTFENLDHEQHTLLNDLAVAAVTSSEEFLEKYVQAIMPISPAFATAVGEILAKANETPEVLTPELEVYKTADDGRNCFTANLLQENLEDQTYEILNSNLMHQLKAVDQSLLTLHTALNVYARQFGMIDFEQLKKFVFYSHTTDFQNQLASGKISPEMFKKLIHTFLPEYETR